MLSAEGARFKGETAGGLRRDLLSHSAHDLMTLLRAGYRLTVILTSKASLRMVS